MRSPVAVCCALLLVSGSLWARSPRVSARTLAPATADRGDGLRRDEQARLLAGGLVTRPMRFRSGDGSYVGGLAYQLVRASPEEVLATLLNVNELPNMIPRTKNARLVSAGDGEAVIELTQGNALVDATYSVRLVRDVGSQEVRFWLDTSRPHGVRDVWGYFRVQRHDARHSLLTVAVALDLGPGLARMFFEPQIQKLVLATPRQIRDYIEPRALAARE